VTQVPVTVMKTYWIKDISTAGQFGKVMMIITIQIQHRLETAAVKSQPFGALDDRCLLN
jgi:hypothetical protein